MTYFERTVCVSLARRHDRWTSFINALPTDWPFGVPEKYVAIDGSRCLPPPWWKQGRGAWGCYRSHLNIIEQALNNNIESVLLLEDDAECVEHFGEQWDEFYKQLPEDWELLYLGGQHLRARAKPPRRLTAQVLVPHNVNRTHAWALKGKGLIKAYRHLTATHDWKPRKHIDHRMGDLVARAGIKCYAPSTWLIGQSAGKSDVNGRTFPEPRFWQGSPTLADGMDVKHKVLDDPFVIVLGLHRSGSSCMAGILHHLGIYMGKVFVGCEPDGGYEARQFARACESLMPFPKCPARHPPAKIFEMLAHSVRNFQRDARQEGTIAGSKYPHFCALGSYFHHLLGPNLKVVHIDRPLEESIASLKRRSGKRHSPQKLEQLQCYLWDMKQAFLQEEGLQRVDVNYHDLLQNPAVEVARVASFLGVAASPKAISYVNPALQHIRV